MFSIFAGDGLLFVTHRIGSEPSAAQTVIWAFGLHPVPKKEQT
jgi:hypothetical protein